MKHLSAFVCLAAFVVSAEARAATVERRSPTGGSSLLIVDGVAVGTVLGWEGGDLRASASREPAAKPGVTTSITPLMASLAFPPSAPLAAWINEVAAGRAPRKKLVVVDFDPTMRPREALELEDAMLTGITLPMLDATQNAQNLPEPIRLVFTGGSSRAILPPGGAKVPDTRPRAASFALQIAGLETRGVSRIGAIQIVQPVADAGRVDGKPAGGVELAPVAITITHDSAKSWRAWLDELVAKGGANAARRDATIAILGPTGKPGPDAIVLSGCTLLRLSRPPNTAGVPATQIAEIVFERLAFAAPAAAPASPDQVANDAGLRDPAEFPRVAGLTRLSYSGTYNPSHTLEYADYATLDALADVVKRVHDAATTAGWQLRNHSDSQMPAGLQVQQTWGTESATATLKLSERKPDAGTHLSLQVYITKN